MARSARPVEIVYYPKNGRPPRSTLRKPTVETAITEVVEEPRKRARKTLTDETPDPSIRAFSELSRLGHACFESGRPAEARVIFESIIALGHSDPFAFTMLGTIDLGAGQFDAALKAFDSALRIDEDDVVALVYRGEIRLAKKKHSAAAEDLERAMRLGDSGDPFVGRARKLLAMARANRTA